MSEAVIQVDQLTKRFGELAAVDDVSMAVARGEVVGLLGPNGAGKSTTLRCLLGLIKPTSGACTLFGLDAWRNRVAAHRRIGVLPSDFSYEGQLTGREVLRLFSQLRGADVSARTGELAERLRSDLDRPLKELSRGNHQKIGLILALAHDPELVLMDEPTAGLDPLMQEEFLRIVEELRAEGRTVLLSSHNMAEVERTCDRIALIHEGKLLEVTEVESLLARAPKEVRAVFATPPADPKFSAIPGVSDVQLDGATLSLKVTGAVDAVIHAVAQYEIVDFVCERPSLESTFVELYNEDGR